MNRRRLLVAVGSVTVGSSLLVGSNALPSGEHGRELTVDVAGDDEAFLTLRYEDHDLTDASPPHRVVLVELRNSFDVPIQIEEFEIRHDETVSVTDREYPDTLGVGASEPVTATIELLAAGRRRCARAGGISASIEFDVTVSGDGVTVETAERRAVNVELDCSGE